MNLAVHQGIEKLKSSFPEAQFIVFGSQAKGNPSKESDLDLCVIFSYLTQDPFELAYDIREEAQKHMDLANDIFVVSEEAFAERRLELGYLEYIVFSEGIAV